MEHALHCKLIYDKNLVVMPLLPGSEMSSLGMAAGQVAVASVRTGAITQVLSQPELESLLRMQRSGRSQGGESLPVLAQRPHCAGAQLILCPRAFPQGRCPSWSILGAQSGSLSPPSLLRSRTVSPRPQDGNEVPAHPSVLLRHHQLTTPHFRSC